MMPGSRASNWAEFDMNKIKDLFLPFEAEAIRRTPIRRNDMQDSRYWIYEKKGPYSVKTGYWAIKDHTCQSSRGKNKAKSSSTNEKIWRIIRNLQVPPKVKIFLWIMTNDSIACEANLKSHHVPVDPRCVICDFNWANTTHSVSFARELRTFGRMRSGGVW